MAKKNLNSGSRGKGRRSFKRKQSGYYVRQRERTIANKKRRAEKFARMVAESRERKGKSD